MTKCEVVDLIVGLIAISSKRHAVSVSSFCTSSFYYIRFLLQRRLFYRTCACISDAL